MLMSRLYTDSALKSKGEKRKGANQNERGRFQTCPYVIKQLFCIAFYAFPASFNALSTFSGLSGSFVMRTPVAL